MSKSEVMKAMRETLEAEGVKVIDFPISDEMRGAQPSFVVVDDEEWNGEGDYSDAIESHLRSKSKKISDWMMRERLGVNDVAGEAAKDEGIAVVDRDSFTEVAVMLVAAKTLGNRMIELVYEAERPINAYRSGDLVIADRCPIALDWSEGVAELKRPKRVRLDDGRKAWQTCYGPADRSRNPNSRRGKRSHGTRRLKAVSGSGI